jgi:WD40 repeat protein
MANRKTLLFIVLIFVAVGAVLAGFIAYTMSSWEYRGCFTSIAFSSDGSRMLTRIGGGGAGMLLWDVNTGREIRTIRSGGM